MLKGIPVIYADPGIDLVDGGIARGMEIADYYTQYDYHQVSDEITDKWDYSGIEQDLAIFTEFVDDIANSGEYPIGTRTMNLDPFVKDIE